MQGPHSQEKETDMGLVPWLDLGSPHSCRPRDREATARRRSREGYHSPECQLPSYGRGVGIPARPAWLLGFQGPHSPQPSPHSRQPGFMTSQAEVTWRQC